MAGHEWEPGRDSFANPLQGPNAWAPSLSGDSKEALQGWYNESVRLSLLVATGLADALRMEEASVRTLCRGGETISLMRLFRYVARGSAECVGGAPPETERTGSSPHTDWGFLTLILGDGAPGLQVKHAPAEATPAAGASPRRECSEEGAEVWHELDPEARREPLLICGDYLGLLTDHRFRSPVHRVLLPRSDPRASFVFFYYPSYGAHFADLAATALGEKRHGRVQHNTMLDLAAADPGALDVPFGEYIRRKWGGVFKA